MNINVTDEQMKGLVSEAIMRAVDQKTRNALIEAAITHLLEKKTVYGETKSPLQDAFNTAIYHKALEVSKEIVGQRQDIKDRIADLVSKAIVKMLEKEDDVVDKLARTIADAFTPRTY